MIPRRTIHSLRSKCLFSKPQSKQHRISALFTFLFFVSNICASTYGFVANSFERHAYLLTSESSLSAVQADERTKVREEHSVLPADERGLSASKLEYELIRRRRAQKITPTPVNHLLNDLTRHMEIRCGRDSADAYPDDPERTTQSTSSQKNKKQEENSSTEAGDEVEVQQQRRKLTARAALLGSRSVSRKPKKSAPPKASNRASTSVGARRTGSASRDRQGPGVTKRIMDAVRKSASANQPSSAQNDESIQKDDSDTPSASFADSLPLNKKLTSTGIHAAVLDIVDRQKPDQSNGAFLGWEQNLQLQYRRPLPLSSRIPSPGTVLIPAVTGTSSNTKLCFPDCVTVKIATPSCDREVANLRLSVFSDFSPEVRRQLVSRSVKAVVTRRMLGATCLIATVPPSVSARKRNRPPVVLGSAECSFHEFEGTAIGQRRLPESILYITEVAVSPLARRRGIGEKLLKAVDTLAEEREIETLYLHVDVENEGALRLYEKAGYRRVDSADPMFLEFTTKLNLHDGATKGRNHYLLYKDMVSCPKWLPPPAAVESQSHLVASTSSTLGFEVPC